mmetsp:Transcript_9082/g.27999  ORF Transcript_9082/g.27999 Transcript_9082/m.27999 type:complete len:200 (-) Transcript_9082:18-617(-)
MQPPARGRGPSGVGGTRRPRWQVSLALVPPQWGLSRVPGEIAENNASPRPAAANSRTSGMDWSSRAVSGQRVQLSRACSAWAASAPRKTNSRQRPSPSTIAAARASSVCTVPTRSHPPGSGPRPAAGQGPRRGASGSWKTSLSSRRISGARASSVAAHEKREASCQGLASRPGMKWSGRCQGETQRGCGRRAAAPSARR